MPELERKYAKTTKSKLISIQDVNQDEPEDVFVKRYGPRLFGGTMVLLTNTSLKPLVRGENP